MGNRQDIKHGMKEFWYMNGSTGKPEPIKALNVKNANRKAKNLGLKIVE